MSALVDAQFTVEQIVKIASIKRGAAGTISAVGDNLPVFLQAGITPDVIANEAKKGGARAVKDYAKKLQ